MEDCTPNWWHSALQLGRPRITQPQRVTNITTPKAPHTHLTVEHLHALGALIARRVERRLASTLREDYQALLVLLEALDVAIESLLRLVAATVVDGDADGTGLFRDQASSLSHTTTRLVSTSRHLKKKVIPKTPPYQT